MTKFQNFDQYHRLTPLEECKFVDFFKSMFLSSRKASFLFRAPPNTFSWHIWPEEKRWRNFKILTKPWTNVLNRNHNLRNVYFSTKVTETKRRRGRNKLLSEPKCRKMLINVRYNEGKNNTTVLSGPREVSVSHNSGSLYQNVHLFYN